MIMAKSIKIPKVNSDDLYDLKIYRTGIIQTKKGATLIRLKGQIIEGVQIPRGLELWSYRGYIDKEFTANPIYKIGGNELNNLLRHLVMEGLRNG